MPDVLLLQGTCCIPAIFADDTCLQIAGGHKYLPPRQDVNAPDLYIPFMAMCTYVILSAATLLARGQFQPTSIPAMVRYFCIRGSCKHCET